ncbi:MAG: LytTR family DNA-binding domain-containing protein [Ruminococcus sp.]|jgi:DNA-binding LytR/AlgR family response regulator|nr:LytTR family DNA-binding domain-containing protein [Ruminococcus sp.]
MFNIAVCDDERDIVDYLLVHVRHYLEEKNIENITYKGFTSIEELLPCVSDFDLLLLDIEIGDESGLEFAKTLRKNEICVPIIFITSYVRYSFEAYVVHPYAYITKPIRESNLKRTLDEFFKSLDKLIIKPVGFHVPTGIVTLNPDDIYYFQYLGRKDIVIVTEDKRYTTLDRLDDIQKRLEGFSFFRASRTTLFNLNKVKFFSDLTVVLKNGDRIAVSQQKKQEFYSRLSVKSYENLKKKGVTGK